MEHGSGALASTNEVRAQNNRLRPAATDLLASPTRVQGSAATTVEFARNESWTGLFWGCYGVSPLGWGVSETRPVAFRRRWLRAGEGRSAFPA